MRRLLTLFLAIVMLFTVVGCTPNGNMEKPDVGNSNSTPNNAGTSNGQKRVLRVAGESWQVSKIFLEGAARLFEAKHPDVDVEIITYADTSVLATYTLDWTQGNTDVDLVFLDGGVTFAKQFDAKGLIYDFEKDLDIFANYDVNKLKPGVLDYGRVNGNLINFPIIFEVYGVSVNLDMFREAGLVDENGDPLPIKTWDDFYEYAKKLTIKDENGVITQQGASIQFGNNLIGCIAAALAGQTGRVIADDGISFDIETDDFRYILENWQKGVLDGYYSIDTFADNSGGRNALKAGNLAMCFESAGRWMEAEAMLGEGTISVLPVPGGKGTYGFGGGVVIPKCSPNADLACAFITETLLGEYVQTNTFTQYGKMSVVAEYYDKAVESVTTWSNLDESMKNALMPPTYEDGQKWLDGICAILQAGLVDANTTPDQMISEMVELMASIKK